MERIETINLKTETDALEAGHGITLYTFDEYGRLMHYAHIVASTPKEREDGYADYFLTIFKGGDDMRRFDPDDGNDYPNFESIIESIKTIWSNTPIWWERDGSVPGVDAGITYDELRGADMLANARKRLENEMRPRGMPTAGAAMMRFHQWIDHVWPAGEPLTIIAHNAQFDVGFLDAAERVYDPTSPVFDCKWACTKEMSWELNPQKRHHRVADLIVDYHIGDVEEHRALSDAIQEQMLYQALCAEATRRGKWNERED